VCVCVCACVLILILCSVSVIDLCWDDHILLALFFLISQLWGERELLGFGKQPEIKHVKIYC